MNTTSVASSTGSHPIVRKMKRFFVGAIVFVLLIAGATVAFLMFASYGDGYRVGVIQKIAKKGVLFKTYEGELTQGFMEGTSDAGAAGVGTRIWYFTVDNDPKVLADIDHAIETNKKVKLFYKEKYTSLPWVGDTRQVVFKVEEVQ
ncbi:MAG: hypothetical protein JST04_06180 [Bdellovibrionales bacterium]|nr:hypothetical protein [Bdellovibrionales bacterium]